MKKLSLVVAVSLLNFYSHASADEANDKAMQSRKSWSAFECAVYAGIAKKGEAEYKRLFNIGLESARTFIAALRAREIPEKAFREIVPIGMISSLQGPTDDFILGRIYENVSRYAYDNITKNDSSGMPLELGQWITDEGLKKTKADTKYNSSNCELIR